MTNRAQFFGRFVAIIIGLDTRSAHRMINYGCRDRVNTRLVSHDHFLINVNFVPAAKVRIELSTASREK